MTPLTYAEVGATRSRMPRSAHHLTVRQPVGPAAAFDAAAECVLTFGMQRGAAFTVTSSSPRAVEGAEYGTLPGHPESVEELFLVERVGDQAWAEVVAFSRPGVGTSRSAVPSYDGSSTGLPCATSTRSGMRLPDGLLVAWSGQVLPSPRLDRCALGLHRRQARAQDRAYAEEPLGRTDDPQKTSQPSVSRRSRP